MNKQSKQEHEAQCALIQEFIREAHARRDVRLAERAAFLSGQLDRRRAVPWASAPWRDTPDGACVRIDQAAKETLVLRRGVFSLRWDWGESDYAIWRSYNTEEECARLATVHVGAQRATVAEFLTSVTEAFERGCRVLDLLATEAPKALRLKTGWQWLPGTVWDAPHESYETDTPFGRVRIEARQVACTHNNGEVHHDVTRWFVTQRPGLLDAECPEYFKSAEDAAAWCVARFTR